MTDVRLIAAGDAALIAEFDERIDPDLNARVVALAGAISSEAIPGVRDVVPTFRSVAVYFDPLLTDVEQLSQKLLERARYDGPLPPECGAPVEIPVCYGGELGPDLGEVARYAGLAADEVVIRHTARGYRAYMIGFLPGFAYLGVVDTRIAAPRRPTPRTSVPAGSVGIAGPQTGVYSHTSPGGWNLIGRTPLLMFNPSRSQPSLVVAGDAVRFRAIDRDEFDRLSRAV
jgi:KipI family sensor histidine kinase inhibitor